MRHSVIIAIYYYYCFIFMFLPFLVLTKLDCKTRLEKCELRKPYPRRQVCGTDNKTYQNRCALLRVQCSQNNPLSIKHRGRCKEKQPCWLDQGRRMIPTDGLKYNQSPSLHEYMPECLADGTYAPVQCHKTAGYCWCVSPGGKVIPGTSVQHKRPKCPKKGRQNQYIEHGKKKSIKDCDQMDRIIFFNNLVRIFKTEYNRDIYSRYNDEMQHNMRHNGSNSVESRATEWKFLALDKDGNRSLSKSEYRDLRKLVRKVVKPRRCSRVFIHLCDTDQNSLITKQEWTYCLTINSTKVNVKRINAEITLDQAFNSDEMDTDDPVHETIPVFDESSIPLNSHSINLYEGEKQEPEANDCLSDRRAVLEELKYGSQEMYVPECTTDGRYKKIQCYKSTGYCWCVLEDSGKPIPGTSVKDINPKCDPERTQIPRLMKGCPDKKKIIFINDLIQFFKGNISNDSDFRSKTTDNHNMETHEFITSLAFNSLDSNKNKMLDKKEWKVFRVIVSTHKLLRRCGRKLPRYCDINHDHKITLTEWLNCLNIRNMTSSLESSANSASLKRRGPNPLQSYLKEDD